jgi:hypothetical protein
MNWLVDPTLTMFARLPDVRLGCAATGRGNGMWHVMLRRLATND